MRSWGLRVCRSVGRMTVDEVGDRSRVNSGGDGRDVGGSYGIIHTDGYPCGAGCRVGGTQGDPQGDHPSIIQTIMLSIIRPLILHPVPPPFPPPHPSPATLEACICGVTGIPAYIFM